MKSKILMIIGALLLSTAFFMPIWNITLEAPQYPQPLGMDIYIDHFEGANDEFDIQNINLMNHYIGMQYIPETIPEFEYFKYILAGLIILGIGVGLVGNRKLYIGWFILVAIAGSLALYDFYMWEYDYGHNLNPDAIMSFKNADGTPMGFQPPLFGSKLILNFTAHSYPRAGMVFIILGITFSLIAFLISKPKKRSYA